MTEILQQKFTGLFPVVFSLNRYRFENLRAQKKTVHVRIETVVVVSCLVRRERCVSVNKTNIAVKW